MKIYNEISLRDFNAWGDAVNTLEILKLHDKCEEVETVLGDVFPDGIGEVELNDLFAYDSDTVFEWAGIGPYEEDEDEE